MKPLSAIIGVALLVGMPALLPAQSGRGVSAVEPVAADSVPVETVLDLFFYSDEFSTIDRNARLDMADYYESGKKERLATRLGGTAYIDSISGTDYLKVITSSCTYSEVRRYETETGTVFALIQTAALPAADSRIRFFRGEDSIEPLLEVPQTEDFLTKDGKKRKKELVGRMDFLLVKLEFLSNGDIVARNTTGEYLSKEDSAFVSPYMKPEILYRWTGKKFRQEK